MRIRDDDTASPGHGHAGAPGESARADWRGNARRQPCKTPNARRQIAAGRACPPASAFLPAFSPAVLLPTIPPATSPHHRIRPDQPALPPAATPFAARWRSAGAHLVS